jgi:hypothetical protein
MIKTIEVEGHEVIVDTVILKNLIKALKKNKTTLRKYLKSVASERDSFKDTCGMLSCLLTDEDDVVLSAFTWDDIAFWWQVHGDYVKFRDGKL